MSKTRPGNIGTARDFLLAVMSARQLRSAGAATRLDAIREHDRCTVAPFAVRLSTVVILKCHCVFCKNRLGFDAHNPAEENDRGLATTNINTRPLNQCERLARPPDIRKLGR
jgi:hypothetical protein